MPYKRRAVEEGTGLEAFESSSHMVFGTEYEYLSAKKRLPSAARHYKQVLVSEARILDHLRAAGHFSRGSPTSIKELALNVENSPACRYSLWKGS